jgi:cysteine desulfurase/selenocysteine lyase
LNHAAAGVLPRATRDVLLRLIEGQARAGVLGFAAVEASLPGYRERVGAFVGARGDDIAFLRNTGDGANTIARGLDWVPGDEIVLCDNEFGANALPWLALREAGVSIRLRGDRARALDARGAGARTRCRARDSWRSPG